METNKHNQSRYKNTLTRFTFQIDILDHSRDNHVTHYNKQNEIIVALTIAVPII